jgi:hypothetical protein
MKSIFCALLLTIPAFADVVDYQLIFEQTLTGTSQAITLAAPASTIKTNAQVTDIVVWSDQSYTVVVKRDGTAPSGGSVALTPTLMNPHTRASSMLAYHTSNSTGGVALTPTYAFSGSTLMPLSFKNTFVSTDSAANITVTITASVGAKVTFQVYYSEKR